MKNSSAKNRWITIVTLLIILAIGAYLRLYRISEYMTFLGDEGRDVLIVKRMIVDHKFTLLGPTASVGGFFMGPIYYYFMLPFLWMSRLDPVGPAIMVALFGIATIYLVYRVGRDFFDETAGVVAAGLYALSPLVIAYSRASWNPNLVPFFATLLIWLLLHGVVKRHWSYLFWIGVVLGIGLQLHYVFLFLFPVVILGLLLWGRDPKLWRWWMLGLTGFLVGWAPFLAFELRHGFPNTISIFRFLTSGKDTGFSLSQFFATINDTLFRLFGRLVFRLPQPEIWTKLPAWPGLVWLWTIRAAIITTLVYVLVQLRGRGLTKSGNEPRTFGLLFLWLVIPLLLFGLYRRAIYDYYFGIFYSLPFIYLGVFLTWAWRQPRIRWFTLAGFAILVVFNWQGRPFLYPPNRQLEQTKRIAQAAFEKANGEPFNFALITGQNSDHAYRYFFEIWGNKPVTIENEDNDPGRQTVTDQLLVICEIPNCKPLGHPLWEVAGFGRAQIVGEWEVPFVTVFKLIHYQGDES